LEILKELYDDFNLEEVQHEEIIYHTDYWSWSDHLEKIGRYCSANI
jgi:hypothetical protein